MRLFIIYWSLVIGGLLIGFTIYNLKPLNEEIINNLNDSTNNLNDSSSKLGEVISYWEFKDLVVDIDDYFSKNLPKRNLIIFGVDFSLTSGDSPESKKERENLYKFLRKENTKATYQLVSGGSEQEKFEYIKKNVKNFKENFKEQFKGKDPNPDEILKRIHFYVLKGPNPLHARITILDGKIELYQFNSDIKGNGDRKKFQNLAIKITDTREVRHITATIESYYSDKRNHHDYEYEKL